MPKRKRNAKLDDFLEELFAEKLRSVLKRMDRTDYLRTLQEYVSNPGSSITLILSFSETQAEAEISVMKAIIPESRDSNNSGVCIKS